jgi:mono/diheme cytochrome c family protein
MKEILSGIKSKTEYITQNPGAVFGSLYLYVLVIGIAIGIYYVNNLENISRQTVPVVLPDTTVVTDLTIKNAVEVPPIILADVKNPSAELISEGEKLYKKNCAACHGESGVGGGIASAGLNPAPRNFTSKDNWKNGTKLSQIYTTLQEGLPPSAMISYNYLLPKERFAIAHYIRKNFIPLPNNDSDADLQALDATYNLSSGLKLAAQIPVAKAEMIILYENENQLNKIKTIVSSINNFSNEDGYNIFNSVVKNKNIAVSFLIKNENWKQNKNIFINLVTNNVNQNGFNGKVFNLNNSDWDSLYILMLKLI